jgi:hypothetical protein
MSYLFVEGVAGAAFVVESGLGASDWLQPVSIVPNTKPNSTIRDIRFIVGVTFTKTQKRTSKILKHRSW